MKKFIIILSVFLFSCSKQEIKIESKPKECKYDIEISKAPFTETVCKDFPRVGKGSMFYRDVNSINGYRIILKKDGVKINERFAKENEIDFYIDEMMKKEIKKDSICELYERKYDSIFL